MSPKRERRKRARQAAERRSEGGIQWLGVLFILSGAAMLASGLYLLGIIPPQYFPPLQRFWEPAANVVLAGAIADLMAGALVVGIGIVGMRKRLEKRLLYLIMAGAFVGLVGDMLGGLYAVGAQATWYLSLFTVLFRR